jgi:hypothetical protein
MTSKQKRALGKQILVVAAALGVKGWEWNIHPEPTTDEGKAASVSVVYGRRVAHLWFCHQWWDMDAEERHHVLVHEVIHVVTDPLTTYLSETLPSLLGMPAWTAVKEVIRQHDEHATDQLASALSPHIPVMEDPT